MTTPNPFEQIITITDLPSLRLVARLYDSQTIVLEAQLSQLNQVQAALKERIAELGGR